MKYARPLRLALAAIAAMMAASPASAGNAVVDVKTSDGKPLAGAVVLIDTGRKISGDFRFSWGREMAQRNIQFDPQVLIVPVGSTITFPNKDKVRHHVYSFSKAKKFDLKLYGRDETRSVTFDLVGPVTLGCNIHDAMNGVVWVVDTPFANQTGANGRATITNVPAGNATMRIWHPSIRAPGNVMTMPATISATGYAGSVTVRAR